MQGRPLHVVQALASLGIGGSELVAVELTEALRRAGHQVTVIAADGPLAARVVASGAKHLDWPIGRKRLSGIKLAKQLRQWFRRERPDLVHVHSRFPAWLVHFARRGMQHPPALVSSVHGCYSVNRYSAIMNRGDAVIAVSNHVREHVTSRYPKTTASLQVIHGGTSSAAFPYGYQPDPAWRAALLERHPELEGKRLLCLPGRMSRYKGHRDFIHLLAELRQSHPDVHGLFLGEHRAGSSYQQELQRFIADSGLADSVTITGMQTDVRPWMAISSIVYNLTRNPPEAFGRTMVEALRLGRPAIGWQLGGVGEILAEMFPAGLVPPGDLNTLLDRSRAFLDQPPPVPESDAFGLEDSMRRTLAVYRMVTAEGGAA